MFDLLFKKKRLTVKIEREFTDFKWLEDARIIELLKDDVLRMIAHRITEIVVEENRGEILKLTADELLKDHKINELVKNAHRDLLSKSMTSYFTDTKTIISSNEY